MRFILLAATILGGAPTAQAVTLTYSGTPYAEFSVLNGDLFDGRAPNRVEVSASFDGNRVGVPDPLFGGLFYEFPTATAQISVFDGDDLLVASSETVVRAEIDSGANSVPGFSSIIVDFGTVAEGGFVEFAFNQPYGNVTDLFQRLTEADINALGAMLLAATELSFYTAPLDTASFDYDPDNTPYGDPSPIPLPASAWVLAAGLGALGLGRRRS